MRRRIRANPRACAGNVRALGYACELEGPSWVGARPVLPDYLPGIGRAPGAAKVFYAIGHQHIGLTIAPITAELDRRSRGAARAPARDRRL